MLIVLIFGFISATSSHYNHEYSNDYQFLKRKYEEKSQPTTNYGFVSIPNIIKENEYLSYRDNQGNNILISNFGEEEYECFGSCYCDERKASVSNIISKRISYLLVSISTIIAYKKAKLFFDSKCSEELSKECHQSLIKSSVEKCSPILKKEDITDEQYFEDRKNDDKRIYFCYGNCVGNNNHHTESTIKQFKHFKCEKLKQEGKVIVYERDLISRKEGPSRNFLHTARSRFAEYYLVDFCKENSKMEYEYDNTYHKKKNGKLYHSKKKFIGTGCIGRNEKSHLTNVRCRQIEPKPTTEIPIGNGILIIGNKKKKNGI